MFRRLTMAACLSLAVAGQAWAQTDTGSEIRALRTHAAVHGERLWPGYGTAPFGFLVLEPQREVLLCREPMPDGFTPEGTDAATDCPRFVRPRSQLPGALLAAMPLFGPPWTIVMGPAPADPRRLPRWRSTVLHEHTHQWQAVLPGYYSRVGALDLSGGDQTGMWMINFAFPYADRRVAAAYREAALALVDAVEGRGTPGFRARLRDYVKARRAFARAAGERNWRYFEFQLWQEGVARWTEIQLTRLHPDPATAADAPRHEQEMLGMLRKPDLPGHQRVVVYAYGMAEAMLMDACEPTWRREYPRRLALGHLVERATLRCAPWLERLSRTSSCRGCGRG